MAESRTLLEHLALTCTNQRENVANDVLCHILSSSESARLALQEMLRDGGAEVGSVVQGRLLIHDLAGWQVRTVPVLRAAWPRPTHTCSRGLQLVQATAGKMGSKPTRSGQTIHEASEWTESRKRTVVSASP